MINIECRGTVRAGFRLIIEIEPEEYERLTASGNLHNYLEDEAAMLVDDGGVDLNPDIGELEVHSVKSVQEPPPL